MECTAYDELQKRFYKVVTLNLILTFIALLFITIEWIIGYRIQCPIHHFTGINCPGCGTTRLMESIFFDFNIYQAFRWNPFVFVMTPVLFTLYVYQTVVFLKTGHLSFWIDKALITFVVLLLLFGIIRNTDMFYFLSPTELSMETPLWIGIALI